VNIILFGPPGAGKGTQADKIVSIFNLHKISTGDLLRNEIQNKSNLGIKIKSIIDKGYFVSDEIINNLISTKLSNKKLFNRLVFDGYPRNLDQAKNLDVLVKKFDQKISCVLSLKVDKELIVKRILGRQICTKCGLIFNKFFNPSSNLNHTCNNNFLKERSDDNEKTIESRYKVYLEKTLPVLNFYKEQKLLHEINGKNEIDQIFEEIRAIIAALQAWLYEPELYK